MTTKQLQAFIKWLRAERISYTTLSAGGVTLDGVVDLKAVDESKPTKPEEKQTMYQRFGGALLTQPSAKRSDAVPDEAMSDD